MDGRESSRMNPSDSPGMIVGPNSYPNSSMAFPCSGSLMPGMRLSFNPMAASGPKPMDGSNSFYQGDNTGSLRQCGVLSMSEPPKKKRGRPRKYGPDGSMALALCPISSSPGYLNSNSGPMSEPPPSKKRGRPAGSGRKQQLDALGSAGIAFTPHVITVKVGEDVSSKIIAFTQQGPRAVCILSATGAICNVTLRQPATSGGTVTYEGRFEIISLTGSFLLAESGGTRIRSGGLSVALVGPDGRILGGGVAGMLKAATPVQVVMGSFIAEGKKPKVEQQHEPSSAPPPSQPPAQPPALPQPQMPGFGAPSASSPPSQGTSSESDDDDDDDDDDDGDDSGSPGIDMRATGATYNSGQQNHNPILAYNSVGGWPHSTNHFTRHDSDVMHN